MQKTMDKKLTALRMDPDCREFIIAYAADADMAMGIPTAGMAYPPQPEKENRYLSIQEYCEHLEAIQRQGKIDILLTSVSTMDVLARQKRLFDNSPVTPAIRANDTTDIWVARGAVYKELPSRPFATTTIEEAQYGTLLPDTSKRPDVSLGLYSVTFNNNFEADWLTLERFKEFRVESVRKGFRYFLEVFNPNAADLGVDPEMIPDYVNDQIARMLAGIPRASRPEFLKVAYNGPATMEALVNYDRTVIVGVLGGEASTTYDAYKLLAEAKKYGARVSLFGRRIKAAEHSLSFVKILRLVADEEISPEEAVKAYRSELKKRGIPPRYEYDIDMTLVTSALKLSVTS